MTPEFTCATCFFFHGIPDRCAGECRIDPPRMASNSCAIWPAVQHDDWCGEHTQPAAEADLENT